MEVAEKEAEERELGDRAGDHARGVPPEPELRGVPGSRTGLWSGVAIPRLAGVTREQLLKADRFIERLVRVAVGGGPLKRARQRPHEEKEDHRERPRHQSRAWTGTAHDPPSHGCGHRRDGGGRGSEHERQGEVVSGGRRDIRQLRQYGCLDIAEVVVARRFARQPRIVRRVLGRRDRRVEVHEVHRLFSAGDLRRVRTEHHVPKEHDRKETGHEHCLRGCPPERRDEAPVTGHNDAGDEREERKRRWCAATPGLKDTNDAEDEIEVAKEDAPQRKAEARPRVRESPEQAQCDGKGSGAQNQSYRPIRQDIKHG